MTADYDQKFSYVNDNNDNCPILTEFSIHCEALLYCGVN